MAVLLAALGSCGGGGPLEVSVGRLVEKPDVYVGDEITTSGVLAASRAGGRPAYTLTDGDDAVAVEPARKVARLVGQSVRVQATFVIDLGGRPVLRIASIEPAGAP